MELREAVEEIRKYHGKGGWWEGSDLSDDPDAFDDAIAEILNAIIDGTLIPAEQCFSVKEGYYGRMYKHSDNPALMYVTTVPLTEALEIRSADDVRREAFSETLDLFESRPDAVKVIRALIDTPQPKGGDDE